MHPTESAFAHHGRWSGVIQRREAKRLRLPLIVNDYVRPNLRGSRIFEAQNLALVGVVDSMADIQKNKLDKMDGPNYEKECTEAC
jgi:hypothetical protein